MIVNKRMLTNCSSILILLSTPDVIMERVNFEYSMKNISIPTKQDYQIQMIKSVEYWRAFHFFYPTQNKNKKETFGFPSTSPAPHVHQKCGSQNELGPENKLGSKKNWGPN